ncbi:ABC transporter substrate-binding protein [Paenibacillus antri]|uniref:ABC transporter substrate-binding protein n=1 Tax=Paenibacillus antri TaxID=2582848 RepID=A0A5R9G2W0_9BACL|nr:ABC transporter substrate-binding protein [Paenibacillus antri]TLS50692.1 ABC transporter substrate-binding protein [Paenibacillus antri]
MNKSRLLVAMTLVLFSVLFAACTKDEAAPSDAPKPSETTEKKDDAAEPTEAPAETVVVQEAPMLSELVASGAIPPLAERLPVESDIMVEPVVEEIGQYGGEWKMPWNGPGDRWTVGQPTEESLFRFSKDGGKVEPNVAKGYDVNENSTEFTIYLREGMKWSDGEPFTADDVIFYWEHMLKKETFGKKVYDAYYSVDPATGDKALAEVTKVDDYTFKVTHKYPSVQFLERVAIDNKWFFAPEHFHRTILPEFVGEEKALAIAKEWGFEDVQSFLVATGYYYWINPEIPTLRAWVAKNDPDSDQFIMERNPYYWKVDEEGKQLPYIDRIVATKIQDPSHKILGTLAGDYNLTWFGAADFTVLKENEQKAGYRVIPWSTAAWSSAGVQLNQTIADPKLRKLFQDAKFREALSIGVNRVEITEIYTNGIAEPIQASVPEGLVGYQDGWRDQWAAYEPDRANQLLDELGLKKGADGFRTHPDGSDLTLTIIDGTTDTAPFLELLKKYYEEMGLKTDIKVVDQATHQELKYSNQVPLHTENISVANVAFRPDTLVPLRVLTPWSIEYGRYAETGGKEGMAPIGDVAEIMKLWDRIKAAKTTDEINKLAADIVKIHQKNQWVIGYAGPTPNLIVASNKIRNVPTDLIWADEFRSLGHAHPAQFFIQP